MFITICAALTAFFAGMCLANYQRTKQYVKLDPARQQNGNVERVKKLKRSAISTAFIAVLLNLYNLYLLFLA